MKIYFEDGKLRSKRLLKFEPNYRVCASNGYTGCIKDLELIRNYGDKNMIVYTNCTFALKARYVWDDETKTHELYLRNKETGEFVHINELTDKDLKEPHNLEMMFRNGAFD